MFWEAHGRFRVGNWSGQVRLELLLVTVDECVPKIIHFTREK